jgi:hypothetical protein
MTERSSTIIRHYHDEACFRRGRQVCGIPGFYPTCRIKEAHAGHWVNLDWGDNLARWCGGEGLTALSVIPQDHREGE